MIGSMEYAETLAEYEWSDEFPSGWSYIGEGGQRLALIAPDGVIYKKDKPGAQGCNEDEYLNYLKLRKTNIIGWKLPETGLFMVGYECIVSMQYIDGQEDVECIRDGRGFNLGCTCGKRPCTAWEWEKIKSKWGVIDVSAFNIIVTDHARYLIDMVA